MKRATRAFPTRALPPDHDVRRRVGLELLKSRQPEQQAQRRGPGTSLKLAMDLDHLPSAAVVRIRQDERRGELRRRRDDLRLPLSHRAEVDPERGRRSGVEVAPNNVKGRHRSHG